MARRERQVDVDALPRNRTFRLLDELGRAIVTGTYDVRPFPTEAELAAEHQVSRSVTREAVKMLTGKGLLTARPRKGTSVQSSAHWNLFDADVMEWLLERKFSLTLLRQFSELRIAIEPAAAALAAQNRHSAGLAALTEGYRRMEAAEAGDDDPLEADIAFHVAILQASGNPFYGQFHPLVRTALRTSIQFTNRFNRRTADLPQHRAVLDAIGRGRPKAASAAMAKIIGDVLILIIDAEQENERAR